MTTTELLETEFAFWCGAAMYFDSLDPDELFGICFLAEELWNTEETLYGAIVHRMRKLKGLAQRNARAAAWWWTHDAKGHALRRKFCWLCAEDCEREMNGGTP